MMRTLWMLLIFVFLPTFMCKAEMPAFPDTPNTSIPQNLLKTKSNPEANYSDPIEVRYGFSSLKFSQEQPRMVAIDHRSEDGMFTLVKTAEASALPKDMTTGDFERIFNAVYDAEGMDDLRSILSPKYFQALGDKVRAGTSPYMILAMIQAMRPQDIHIMDFNVHEDRADFSVRGSSAFGPVEGLIRMVKADGLWKIDNENWYAGGRGTRDYIAASLNPLTTQKKYTSLKHHDFMSQLTPDYRVNGNLLSLTKVPFQPRSRRAFTFVFLMNKEKTARDYAGSLYDGPQSVLAKGHAKTHMHVLFVGSRRLVSQQTVEQKYPIDFSVANSEDGYSARQWNLILPNKKPREVAVSLLWNF